MLCCLNQLFYYDLKEREWRGTQRWWFDIFSWVVLSNCFDTKLKNGSAEMLKSFSRMSHVVFFPMSWCGVLFKTCLIVYTAYCFRLLFSDDTMFPNLSNYSVNIINNRRKYNRNNCRIKNGKYRLNCKENCFKPEISIPIGVLPTWPELFLFRNSTHNMELPMTLSLENTLVLGSA